MRKVAPNRRLREAEASEPIRLIGVLVPQAGTGPQVESRYSQFLAGLYKQFRPAHPWVIRVGTENISPDVPLSWKPDGMVVWNEWGNSGDLLDRLKVPAVTVTSADEPPAPGTIQIDEKAVGQMAARFLLERGWRQFGFSGFEGSLIARLRGQGFIEEIEEAGCTCDTYCREEFGYKEGEEVDWVRAGKRSQAWLARLPKPAAVFAWNDPAARVFLESAIRLDLNIPRDLAFLGANDDVTLCEMGRPMISSVSMPYRELGRRAASMLRARLETGELPEGVVLRPGFVTERESTGNVPVDDELISQVQQFIRDHLAEPMNAETLVIEFGVSRRTLEQRFRAATGSTPLREIHRHRIERAKLLLSKEGTAVQDVAKQVGFASAKRFRAVFYDLTGQTPSEFAASVRTDEKS